VPQLSASEMMTHTHEDALYQVYVPLPYHSVGIGTSTHRRGQHLNARIRTRHTCEIAQPDISIFQRFRSGMDVRLVRLWNRVISYTIN